MLQQWSTQKVGSQPRCVWARLPGAVPRVRRACPGLARSPVAPSQPVSSFHHRSSTFVARADPEPEKPVIYNTEFGYSRKDVLIIIVALIGGGILLYEGLQAAGMDAGMAGNWVQLIIFLGICVGWVSTYIWRVSTKNMTYAKQLEMYEASVIQKRLEEMTETEVEQLMSEVDQEKQRGADRRFKRQEPGQW